VKIFDETSILEKLSICKFSRLTKNLIKNINDELLKNSKKELILFSSDLVKKYTFELQNCYYDECETLIKEQLFQMKPLIEKLVNLLIASFVNHDELSCLVELKSSLQKNIEHINLRKLIAKKKTDKILSFDFRLSKLATMIVLTNVFLTKDLLIIWKYVNDFVNDLVVTKTVLKHPYNERLIDILSIFSHFDITSQSVFEEVNNEKLNILKNSISKLSVLIKNDLRRSMYHLKYAQCLLSLNCFDAKFFEHILSIGFSNQLVRE
jgi:hypothetical protein